MTVMQSRHTREGSNIRFCQNDVAKGEGIKKCRIDSKTYVIGLGSKQKIVFLKPIFLKMSEKSEKCLKFIILKQNGSKIMHKTCKIVKHIALKLLLKK